MTFLCTPKNKKDFDTMIVLLLDAVSEEIEIISWAFSVFFELSV